VRDVGPDLDVAEEPAAAAQRLAVEGVLEALDLLVVGRDAAAQQAPGCRQALEEVDVGVAARAQDGRAAKAPAGPAPTIATAGPLAAITPPCARRCRAPRRTRR
jgi:hypothetical protein